MRRAKCDENVSFCDEFLIGRSLFLCAPGRFKSADRTDPLSWHHDTRDARRTHVTNGRRVTFFLSFSCRPTLAQWS